METVLQWSRILWQHILLDGWLFPPKHIPPSYIQSELVAMADVFFPLVCKVRRFLPQDERELVSLCIHTKASRFLYSLAHVCSPNINHTTISLIMDMEHGRLSGDIFIERYGYEVVLTTAKTHEQPTTIPVVVIRLLDCQTAVERCIALLCERGDIENARYICSTFDPIFTHKWIHDDRHGCITACAHGVPMSRWLCDNPVWFGCEKVDAYRTYRDAIASLCLSGTVKNVPYLVFRLVRPPALLGMKNEDIYRWGNSAIRTALSCGRVDVAHAIALADTNHHFDYISLYSLVLAQCDTDRLQPLMDRVQWVPPINVIIASAIVGVYLHHRVDAITMFAAKCTKTSIYESLLSAIDVLRWKNPTFPFDSFTINAMWNAFSIRRPPHKEHIIPWNQRIEHVRCCMAMKRMPRVVRSYVEQITQPGT